MRTPVLPVTSFLLTLTFVLPSPGVAQPRETAAPGAPRPAEGRGLVSVNVEPNPFSPNGDGRRDRATIRVDSGVPSTVRVTVVDARGRVRRAWPPTAVGAAGTLTIRWSGGVGGRKHSDGVYTIRAYSKPAGAATPDVPAVTVSETAVTIDTRAPRVLHARARPTRLVRGHEVTLRFRAIDRAPMMRARIRVMEAVGSLAGVEKEVEPGASHFTWKSPDPLYPGNYRFDLRLQDDAGNRARRIVRWRVERTAKPKVIRRLAAGRRVALTFDDCHRPAAWSRILGVLGRARVKATFFCPGTMVHANPGLARRTVRDGHTPASHAWDHAMLAGRGGAFTGTRVRSDARAWWRVARATSAPYMRPPYGAYDAGVLLGAGASWHPRVIMWDVDPQDWRSPGSGTISSRVLAGARPGSIILLHTLEQTAAALPAIIVGLRNRNLRPVSLPALFRAAGMP